MSDSENTTRPVASEAAVAALAPYLDAPSATTPVWVSGDRIAFLSDRSGVPQVWMTESIPDQPDAPVTAHQLTDLPDRIGALKATPDGQMLIFGMDHGGDERQQLWTLSVPERTAATAPDARALTADPRTIHAFGAVSTDGQRFAFASNARDQRFFDVSTVGLDDPAAVPVLLMAHDELLYPMAYSPDGRHVLLMRTNTNLDHDLFLAGDDGASPVHLTPHDGEASVKAATFEAGGDSLLVATNQDRDFVALLRLDLQGKLLDVIAEPQWDIEGVEVSTASGWLAYSVNVDGISRLTLRSPVGHERDIDGLPVGTIDSMSWSPDGQRLAIAVSSPVSPGAIWVVAQSGQSHAAVAPVYGDLDPVGLVLPRVIRFAAFDGREIPAFWSKPLGSGPFPVIVDVHGGPESQRRANWMPVLQFLVGQGFAVLSTNVRGSTGYGKEYSHLDDVERRYDSVADLASAHDWLTSQPNVDPERIAVFGQSYGGFMVLAALTSQPERWAAGVDVVGIANFVTFLENTGPWRRATRAAEYGDLERDADVLKQISPIHRVTEIRAPLMVIHGRNDPRVPLGETEQIVAAVRERGLPVELLVFDDEGHGLIKRPNRLLGYGAMGDFLSRWLQPVS